MKKTNRAKCNSKAKISFLRKDDQFNIESAKAKNTIGRALEDARKEFGMTQRELREHLINAGNEIHKDAIGRWEKGLSVPNAYQFLAICSILGITDLSCFSIGTTNCLNSAGRKKIEEYKKDLLASGLYKPDQYLRELEYIEMPISIVPVSAGCGSILDNDVWEFMRFPSASVPPDADFGIRISGDSMSPVYADGQIIWVQQTNHIRVGEVGVFFYNGEGFIKVYSEQKDDDQAITFDDTDGSAYQVMLLSYNTNYKPIPINPNLSFEIVGRVLR